MPSEKHLPMVTPIGTLWLREHDGRLAGIEIVAATSGPFPVELPAPAAVGESTALRQAALELDQYFAGRRRTFSLPLELTGLTPFSLRILETLRTIPYGTTITYGALAVRAGFPHAARAVGRAMAFNPLPIVIPCHRVVAAGGRLGGYSGGNGLPTKLWLLEFERSAAGGPETDSPKNSA